MANIGKSHTTRLEQIQNPAVAVTKLSFYDKFTEDGIKKIKEIPMQIDEDLKRFPLFIDDSYKNREKILKPGADKGISRENWFEYVYKIHQNKPILYLKK